MDSTAPLLVLCAEVLPVRNWGRAADGTYKFEIEWSQGVSTWEVLSAGEHGSFCEQSGGAFVLEPFRDFLRNSPVSPPTGEYVRECERVTATLVRAQQRCLASGIPPARCLSTKKGQPWVPPDLEDRESGVRVAWCNPAIGWGLEATRKFQRNAVVAQMKLQVGAEHRWGAEAVHVSRELEYA